MEHQSKKADDTRLDSNLDLDALLHPAGAFTHPLDVVRDPDLTINEKRAILASWASDACAIEAASELRLNTSGAVVRWDDVIDALRTLDREADGKPLPHYKQVLAKKSAGLPGRRSRLRNPGDEGRALN